MGSRTAGFETAVAVERDHDCCETLRTPNRRWEVIERDIFDTPTDRRCLSVAASKKGEADLSHRWPAVPAVLEGGLLVPGGFAPALMIRARTRSRPTCGCSRKRCRAPSLVENVEGLAFAGKDEGLRLLIAQIKAINERTGSHYDPNNGDCQRRRLRCPAASRARDPYRLGRRQEGFASRIRRIDRLTRLQSISSGETLPTYRTAWDAFLGVSLDPDEKLEGRGKWADLLPSIPGECNATSTTRIAAKGSPSSAGAAVTGASCSSSRRTAPRGPCRRNLGRRSAHSTGRAADSRCASFNAALRFPGRRDDHRGPNVASNGSLETRSRPCSPRCSGGPSGNGSPGLAPLETLPKLLPPDRSPHSMAKPGRVGNKYLKPSTTSIENNRVMRSPTPGKTLGAAAGGMEMKPYVQLDLLPASTKPDENSSKGLNKRVLFGSRQACAVAPGATLPDPELKGLPGRPDVVLARAHAVVFCDGDFLAQARSRGSPCQARGRAQRALLGRQDLRERRARSSARGSARGRRLGRA